MESGKNSYVESFIMAESVEGLVERTGVWNLVFTLGGTFPDSIRAVLSVQETHDLRWRIREVRL